LGRPRLAVTADGTGAVSHAGTRLLADLADASTLTGRLSAALGRLARAQTAHDPGRVLADLAVAIADGGECISDIAVLADQPGLFGATASDSTAWRLLDRLTDTDLAQVAAARGAARETAGPSGPNSPARRLPDRAAGRQLPGAGDRHRRHRGDRPRREQAKPTFKHTFGFHPIGAWLDNTGEFLAAILRPANAGSNTAADHIAVLDQAIARIPDQHRHGTPTLVRTDTAGATKAFLTHIAALREQHEDIEFSVGRRTDRLRELIRTTPKAAWIPAVDTDGEPVPYADVAELTGLLPMDMLADYPAGIRIIVRRERPHPGAQLNLFEEADGWRYTASPPPLPPASGNSPTSMPGTAPTPGSKTASAPAKTPAWAGSPRTASPSTKPGS